jgi:hypothetical protein
MTEIERLREALEPCPRCGNGAFTTMLLNGVWEVWCSTDQCLRLPARATEAEAIAAWNTRATTPTEGDGAGEEPDRYDAGLLGDGGGGDVEWWQSYIRAELDRAHEFYAAQWPTLSPRPPVDVEGLVEEWAYYNGPLPDYDHPLRCVFDSGVQYAVELLATALKVKDWTPCDGTEEYDGDLGGTLMNIVLAAMPKDDAGDPIHPWELPVALRQPALPEGEEPMERAKALVGQWALDHLDGNGRPTKGEWFTDLIKSVAAALSQPPGMRKALEEIEQGTTYARLTFEARMRGKRHLTWHAVNVLQEHLAAIEGTARAALAANPEKRDG